MRRVVPVEIMNQEAGVKQVDQVAGYRKGLQLANVLAKYYAYIARCFKKNEEKM